MSIRLLTPEDEIFLWKALYYAIFVPPGAIPPEPDIVEQPELSCYVDQWMRYPDDLGFVTEKDSHSIGAVWIRRWSGQERGYGFVDKKNPELSISVLPGHRGCGIGTRLLRHLLKAAKKRYPAVSLSVSLSNPARRLYEREGFRPTDNPQNGSLIMIKQFTT